MAVFHIDGLVGSFERMLDGGVQLASEALQADSVWAPPPAFDTGAVDTGFIYDTGSFDVPELGWRLADWTHKGDLWCAKVLDENGRSTGVFCQPNAGVVVEAVELRQGMNCSVQPLFHAPWPASLLVAGAVYALARRRRTRRRS
jgi:hypothetical protein